MAVTPPLELGPEPRSQQVPNAIAVLALPGQVLEERDGYEVGDVLGPGGEGLLQFVEELPDLASTRSLGMAASVSCPSEVSDDLASEVSDEEVGEDFTEVVGQMLSHQGLQEL